MIAYTTFLLFVIGIFSSIKVGAKVDKIFSVLTFASIFLVFVNFCLNMNFETERIFSFMWNSSPSGDIKVDIVSNAYNYSLVFPFILITLIATANNVFFKYEERRGVYDAILIFNLIAIIMMITSNNFVQLLSALFVIDILAVVVIKDIEACKRYIILNMLADLMLFTVLALINSCVDSLDIRQILLYKHNGYHQDFVAIVGLTAVFMKMGMVPFHVGFLGLKNIRLHRLQNVLCLFSPLAALILLLKFHGVWATSVLFIKYLDVVCIFNALWCCIRALFVNDFKAKFIYIFLLILSIVVELLKFNGFEWSDNFTYLFLEAYLILYTLYLIYFYSNRKKLISQMLGCLVETKSILLSVIFVVFLAIVALSSTLTTMYNNSNRYYIWSFAVLFVLVFSKIINEVSNRNNSTILQGIHANIKIFPSLIAFFLGGWLLKSTMNNDIAVWGWSIAFIILCVFNPFKHWVLLYDNFIIQNFDGFGYFYKYFIIKPVRFCGKFLWLLIDWLFVEKIILNIMSMFVQLCIRLFRKIHNRSIEGSLVVIILIFILLIISYKLGGGIF